MFTDHKGIQRWRCWSGDHAGTAVDALMLHHRIDLPTALRELETRAGITPPSPPIGTPTAIRTPPRATISPEALEYIDACAQHLWTPHGSSARRSPGTKSVAKSRLPARKSASRMPSSVSGRLWTIRA